MGIWPIRHHLIGSNASIALVPGLAIHPFGEQASADRHTTIEGT